MKVVLFDIDGTLVSAGASGRRAIERAFADLHGHTGVFDFSFGGMTDRGIIRGGFDAAAMPCTLTDIEAVIERYLEVLVEEVANETQYRIMPGVHDAVRLTTEAGFAVGLGTGNVERGARIKLERAGLNHWFSFGGFGCDHEERAELIRAGYQRGRDALQESDIELIVIGDTPRDVYAAHAAGGRCIGVTTGRHDEDELVEAGADWVVSNLSDPQFLEILELG